MDPDSRPEDAAASYPRPFCDGDITPDAIATMCSDEAFADVANERCRQVLMWGPQHDVSVTHWISIIAEELGEAALCANEISRGRQVRENTRDLYCELTQLAAVSIAAMQVLSRHLDAPGGLPDSPMQSTSADRFTTEECSHCAIALAYRDLLGIATPPVDSLTPPPLGEGPGVRAPEPAPPSLSPDELTWLRGSLGAIENEIGRLGVRAVDQLIDCERRLHDLVSTDATIAVQACEELRQQRDALVLLLALPDVAIPADAWHERSCHAMGTVNLRDLSFIFTPDPPLANIVDVRGDVSHSTDGVRCRWGIKVKCQSGHELQLRGGGRNRDAARANLEAAWPRLAAWAAELGGH